MSMPKMDLIFVSSGRHKLTEGIIKAATGSKYAHAALGIEIEGVYQVIEAVRPAIRCSPANIFDDATDKQIISVEITEEQRQAVVQEALSLVGQPYGVDDCAIGGVNDVIGAKAAKLLDKFIDNDQSLNCSGTQTRLVRKVFPEYMPAVDESLVTPEDARKYALGFFPGAVITGG